MVEVGRSVRPLVSQPPTEGTWEPILFGTCFLIHDRRTIMTAAHVVRDANGAPMAVPADWENGGWFFYPVGYWWVSRFWDIAVGRLNAEIPDAPVMQLADELPALNEHIASIEFSQSRYVRVEAGKALELRTSRRVGHVVSDYRDEHPGPLEARYVEVSWPAFKGASGSPLIRNPGDRVVGMVVTSAEHELMPAQVLKYEDKATGTKEEIRFFLPQAKAITFESLRSALAQAIVDFPLVTAVDDSRERANEDN